MVSRCAEEMFLDSANTKSMGFEAHPQEITTSVVPTVATVASSADRPRRRSIRIHPRTRMFLRIVMCPQMREWRLCSAYDAIQLFFQRYHVEHDLVRGSRDLVNCPHAQVPLRLSSPMLRHCYNSGRQLCMPYNVLRHSGHSLNCPLSCNSTRTLVVTICG